MAIKDILVHVEPDEASRQRLGAALQIAREHGAQVSGIHIATSAAVIAPASVLPSTELLASFAKQQQQRTAEAEQRFREALDETPELAGDWHAVDGDVVRELTRASAYTDLLIIGQEKGSESIIDRRGVPDTVILGSGRPTLVIPYIGIQDGIGRNVLIAWNGSRESVRAVNDALPLLKRAEQVVVLTMEPHGGEAAKADIPSADIALHLARHGVQVEARSALAEDIEAGDMLLSRAADQGADLIVMGGYGRARWRELVLGGVTRHLLSHMTVPVFMSH